MAGVRFEHVSKRFGDTPAVLDLNLDVPDKEFIVLVGPSGCGKSTILRMLAGLERISDGKIYIGERVVNEMPARDRDIAMVFQSYALYPHMSVYDNMAFGLSVRKMPRDEIRRRVTGAATILDIEPLLDRKPRALSGGQRQRVALGRAIVREPEVFLMDEPLSNLDAKLRVQTRAELVRLHERLQTTVVYVTHDQVEAMTMGSRIVVLNQGVLQQVDTPQKLYNEPANMFVAGFIGSPPMNFFDAKVVSSGDGLALQLDGGAIAVPPAQRDATGRYRDQHVVLGVRPEHISHEGAAAQDGSALPARVEVVEPLGNETLLYMTLAAAGGQPPFIARAGPEVQLRADTEVRITFDMSRAHAFEKDTGAAIF